jgi:hypothetical protein
MMPDDLSVQALKRGPRPKHRPNVHKFKEALHLLEMKIANKAEKVPLHNHADVLCKGHKGSGPCLEPGI